MRKYDDVTVRAGDTWRNYMKITVNVTEVSAAVWRTAGGRLKEEVTVSYTTDGVPGQCSLYEFYKKIVTWPRI